MEQEKDDAVRAPVVTGAAARRCLLILSTALAGLFLGLFVWQERRNSSLTVCLSSFPTALTGLFGPTCS